MNGKRLLSTAAGAALTLALVACGGGKSTSTQSSASRAPSVATASAGSLAAATATAAKAAPSVRRGGTLTVAMSQDAKTFDPMLYGDSYSDFMVRQVFDPLVMVDENQKPVAWLADSWDISADDLTYTFHLHKSVKFQDGTDFNAQAMKFSMDRIRNNKASPGQSDCGTSIVADTEAPDDSTFQIVLTKPYAPILAKLSDRCGMAVSPTAAQKEGDDQFGLHPVGTGPFKFLEWQQGDHMTAVRNDSYWRMGADGKPLPYLDKVNWRLVQDVNQRSQGLLTGDFDIALSVQEKDIPSLKSSSSVTVAQQPGAGWAGFMLNVSRPPFNSKPLAQAVAYAVDRDEILRVIFDNLRQTWPNGVIPPTLKWAVDPNYAPYSYDPDKAKQKLAEGGQPNGFSFTILLDPSNAQGQQLIELIQSQLKKVGIDMKIETGDFNNVVVKRALSGDFDAAAINITGGKDPDDWTFNAFHTKANLNIPHLSDPQIDQITEQARQETDISKRADLYKQVNKLIMDYSPWIMVANSPDRFVGSAKVQGWYLGTRATEGYSEYWKNAD